MAPSPLLNGSPCFLGHSSDKAVIVVFREGTQVTWAGSRQLSLWAYSTPKARHRPGCRGPDRYAHLLTVTFSDSTSELK